MKTSDSTLFLVMKDCRECFFSSSGSKSRNLLGNNQIISCCQNISNVFLPLNFTELNVNLTDITLRELETAANAAIHRFTGNILNLVRLEEDLLGWSYGLADSMSWTLYIQYGGFQIQGWTQYSPPSTVGTVNYTIELIPWDTLLGFDEYNESVIVTGTDRIKTQIVEISADNQYFPSNGPTRCLDTDEAFCAPQSPSCKLSCFSPYFAIGSYSPASLSTNRFLIYQREGTIAFDT